MKSHGGKKKKRKEAMSLEDGTWSAHQATETEHPFFGGERSKFQDVNENPEYKPKRAPA